MYLILHRPGAIITEGMGCFENKTKNKIHIIIYDIGQRTKLMVLWVRLL